MSGLPAPGVLRQRIEAERDLAIAQAQAGLHTRFPLTLYNREKYSRQAVRDGLWLARCDSALARLDRHGGEHWCMDSNRRHAMVYDDTEDIRCWEYERLASEYPGPVR